MRSCRCGGKHIGTAGQAKPSHYLWQPSTNRHTVSSCPSTKNATESCQQYGVAGRGLATQQTSLAQHACHPSPPRMAQGVSCVRTFRQPPEGKQQSSHIATVPLARTAAVAAQPASETHSQIATRHTFATKTAHNHNMAANTSAGRPTPATFCGSPVPISKHIIGRLSTSLPVESNCELPTTWRCMQDVNSQPKKHRSTHWPSFSTATATHAGVKPERMFRYIFTAAPRCRCAKVHRSKPDGRLTVLKPNCCCAQPTNQLHSHSRCCCPTWHPHSRIATCCACASTHD